MTRGTAGGLRRSPRAVYNVGEEPDPRFSLANERTFLAWIRTGLAFMAAGVALESLQLGLQPVLQHAAALDLVGVGMLAGIQALIGWARTERALRLGRPLPAPIMFVPVVVGVIIAGALAVAAWVAGG